jgi:diaminopimelate epimerase
MQQKFYKYQGTGNDFVMIDNRLQTFDKNNTKLVAHLCDRRFGIGGDGLILLENHDTYDFTMVYYNADGNESTMCGNGGRCLVAFARQLGVIKDKAVFEAVDGLHHAKINGDIVELQMQDVTQIETFKSHVFLDTGSPHHVRYGAPYNAEGTNVNFVKQLEADAFRVRTYERGVENETLSCGTGVTAVAIAMHALQHTPAQRIKLEVEGGHLEVAFDVDSGTYKNVWLVGPAKLVFEGVI